MRKLPVWLTFVTVIRVALSHLDIGWKLIWPWIIVLWLPSAGWEYWSSLHPLPSTFVAIPHFGMSEIFHYMIFLMYGYAFATIAVGWHRYELLGEKPRGLGALQINPRSFSYLLNLIGIFLMSAFIVSVPATLILQITPLIMPILSSTLNTYLGMALLMSVMLGLFVVSTRFLLKAVAGAIGDENISLSSAFQASSGNTIRIAALTAMFFILSWGFRYCTNILTHAGIGISYAPAKFIWEWFVFLIQSIDIYIGIITLTILYGFFVQGRDIDAFGKR